jgi:hypothetical protein
MSPMFDSNSTSPLPPASRYRALNPLAVTSTVVAALSIVTMLSWYLAVVPLAGIIFGWVALRQIRKAPDEWTGLRLAQVGLGLSAAMWVAGYGWLILAKTSEVPFGYHRITFDDDLQPDPAKPTEPIPQTALDLQDGKVFIQGYMQPRRQQTGIKEFVLCPSNGDCPFCMVSPSPTQKIRVILQGDMETTYTTHLISVAGRFRVNMNDPVGIPYGIDADYLP